MALTAPQFLQQEKGENAMAMHKSLQVGTVLCYYPEVEVIQRWYGNTESYLYVYGLVVETRRARTNGAIVPKELEPLLQSLNVRTREARGHLGKRIVAIGCYTRCLYQRRFRRGETIAYEKEFLEIMQTAKVKDARFKEEVNELYSTILSKKPNATKKFVLMEPVEVHNSYVPITNTEEYIVKDIWPDIR